MRVVGKGSGVRTVPFGTKAAAAVDRYMRVRASHRDAARPELWLGLWGPVRPNGLAHKDRAAELWCANATALTGTSWRLLKVPQKEFEKLEPDAFADLAAFAS